MIAAVAQTLEERLGLAGNVTFLKVPGKHALVLLVFPPGGTVPACVVKMPRDPRHSQHLAREAAALLRAGEHVAGSDLAGSVPKVLIWEDSDGTHGCLLAQSALSGNPLIQILRRPLRREVRHSAALLEGAFGWLARFHRAAAVTAADGKRLRDYVLAPFGGTIPADLLPGAGDIAESSLARLESQGLGDGLVSLCHGDYNPYNIIIGAGGMGVCDWEESHVGVPLVDVCSLFTTLVCCHLPCQDHGRMPHRFHAHFFDGREKSARRAMAGYAFDCAQRLGYAPEFLNAYYPIHLLHMASKWQGDAAQSGRWAEILDTYLNRLDVRLSEA